MEIVVVNRLGDLPLLSCGMSRRRSLRSCLYILTLLLGWVAALPLLFLVLPSLVRFALLLFAQVAALLPWLTTLTALLVLLTALLALLPALMALLAATLLSGFTALLTALLTLLPALMALLAAALLSSFTALLTLALVAVLLAGLPGALAAYTLAGILVQLRIDSSLLAWLTWLTWLTWLFFSGHDEVLT
ncbi:hypothetical protein [Azotobacter beijerinckii]|uniref:hypothetical protein n=1 Tax=Azotobacter beijerinckii TaxID=170623 RepID=UPI00147EE52C|nr:hypothetical protein [Azotobacter beijerinckii]